MVAVNDGMIKKIGQSKRARQATSSSRTPTATASPTPSSARSPKAYPVPKQQQAHRDRLQARHPGADKRPTSRSAGGQTDATARDDEPGRRRPGRRQEHRRRPTRTTTRPGNTEDVRQRLYALPERPHNVDRADITGQLDELLGQEASRATRPSSPTSAACSSFDREDDGAAPARGGLEGRRRHRARPDRRRPTSSRRTSTSRSGPPGAARRQIDPKPILDGWKLLEATAIYRAAGKNPFADSSRASARSC